MYGKTVRLSDDTINILEKYRLFMCEKMKKYDMYSSVKLFERMSLSELIFYAIDTYIATDEKQD